MIKTLAGKLKNSQPSSSINSAALVIATAGVMSRLLGLVRDRLLAAKFGAGDTLDIYYAAFRVPDLMYNLLILGALSAAFIPVFTSLIARDEEDKAWGLANNLLSVALLVLLFLSAVFAIFTPQLMKIVTPGFSGEKFSEVVKLTRIMFLSPLLLGISGIFGGILNSFKRFLVYSLAPIMYNLGIIIGVLFFVKSFGTAGLAWGVVLGAFLHMLIQYPAVKLCGFSFQINIGIKNPDLRKVLKLMIPRTMGLAVTQINLLVITVIASTLAAGSLAIFNFANNLQSFPLGIFGIPFALAVFPVLSRHVARNEKEEFARNFSQTLRQILYFVIPASILIIVLRAQIVRVVLGAGQFDWEDTILTLKALGIFAISLFAQSLIPLLARSFYALHDTRTPFFTGFVSEIVNLVLAIFLSMKFGVLGLVWAFSASSILNMFLLFVILRNKTGNIEDRRIFFSTGKIILCAVFSGLLAHTFKYIIEPHINLDTFLGVFAQLISCGAIGVTTYFALSHFLKLDEFESVKKLITFKMFRTQPTIPDDPTQASGI